MCKNAHNYVRKCTTPIILYIIDVYKRQAIERMKDKKSRTPYKHIDKVSKLIRKSIRRLQVWEL